MGAEKILSILAGPIQGQINTNDRKGNPLLLQSIIYQALLGFKCSLIVECSMSEKSSTAFLQLKDSDSKSFSR